MERKSIRVNGFYKYGQGNQYYEGSQASEFDLIDRAWYNYLSLDLAYGLSRRLTLEAGTGFFLNKTQQYNVQSGYKLKGWGFNYLTLLARYSMINDFFGRNFLSLTGGVKIPCRREMQTVDYVQLPIEIQPSSGAFALVLGASYVKEISKRGLRFFLTNRTELFSTNIHGYRLGPSVFSSIYVSKHLMMPWLKGDWTTILQVRNEIRGRDKLVDLEKESSGSILFFVAPQVNYVLPHEWNLSLIVDVPVYQNFNGTQLGAGPGFTISISRTVSYVQYSKINPS
ncbi:MAG: hypothetical protein JW801_16465 [Bacteroidales bacterium]|nr:hypothetical protein [Bacteroidales bacterium]